MASPTVSISLDQAQYESGETITLTIDYTVDPGETMEVTVTVTDAQGRTGTDSLSVQVGGGEHEIEVSDTGQREWTFVSDDGSTAVYTAIA